MKISEMYGTKTVHNFQSSLARSASYVDAPWWEKVYRQAFPGFASMVSIRQDGWAQRGGIDRVVTLKSGKTLTIDEKVREKDWPDFLLERWSSKESQAPGWIQKDLACDFIAYAFAPSQTCYLLPFLQLRKAWLANGPRWIMEYPEIAAKNNGYTTTSIAVPIPEVLQAVSDVMRVTWE